MARVVELDEEIERDVDGVGDVLFSRLGEPVPLTSPPSPFDLSDPPRNPIAISFSARLLFVASSQGAYHLLLSSLRWVGFFVRFGLGFLFCVSRVYGSGDAGGDSDGEGD